MVTSISNDIKISVETAYREDVSNPSDGIYLHTYRVSIVNTCSYAVQLLTRKWIIKEVSGKQTVVNGDGVVGKTPILEAGESFTYVSSCPLESEIGRMRGYYKFIRLDTGEKFLSNIPTFELVCPLILN